MNGHTFAERVLILEQEAQACKSARSDVEQRLRNLERALYVGFGAVAALQVVLKFCF